MNLEQVGLQLGIAGLLVVVGFRIALVFIARWGTVEDARTKAIGEGMSSIALKVEQHSLADLESHSHLGQRLARLEGKLDQANGWTPIHGTPIVDPEPDPPRQYPRAPTPAPVSQYHHQQGRKKP